MALIGQVFGQQGLVDPARQMQAANDYQNAMNQWNQQQQMGGLSQYQAQGLQQAQGIGGIGSGSILGGTLTNKKPAQKKEGNVMDYVKGYFFKHRELLMGLTIVILLDHFIFGGAFREKTQKIVHSLLDKTEKALVSG